VCACACACRSRCLQSQTVVSRNLPSVYGAHQGRVLQRCAEATTAMARLKFDRCGNAEKWREGLRRRRRGEEKTCSEGLCYQEVGQEGRSSTSHEAIVVAERVRPTRRHQHATRMAVCARVELCSADTSSAIQSLSYMWIVARGERKYM
jgi:hypothetical protein